MKALFFTLLAVITLSSCEDCIEGIGDVTNERRLQVAFTEVVISDDFDINLEGATEGTTPLIAINAQENIIPYVSSKVNNGQLTLALDGCVKTSEPILITITAPYLERIENKANGNITSYFPYPTNQLELVNSGSGDVVFKVYTNELKLVNSGSGSLTFQGATRDLLIDQSGSGEIKLDLLSAEHATVESSGSGDVWLKAKSSLEVQLSGSGNVLYRGDPQNLQQENTGSGNIRRAS